MSVLIDRDGKRLDHLLNQATLVWETPSSAAVWTINHRLDKYPSVVCLNDDGDVVFGSLRYVDKNTVEMTFIGPMTGKALIN